MSDTSNIANLLNLNVTGSALGTGSSLFGNISLVSLPPDLQNLDAMQTMEGKILEVKKNGLVMISTEYGNVTINTDAPAQLQNKKEIELRLEAGNPPTKVVLLPPPRNAESKEAEQIQRFDTRPIQTTLTKDAQTLNAALLGAQQILSGIPIQMTLFDTEEPIAQPFMRQTSSALTPIQASTFKPPAPSAVVAQSVEASQISDTMTFPKPFPEVRKDDVSPYRPSIVLENNFIAREQPLYPLTSTAQPIQNEIIQPLPKITSQAKTEGIALPLQNTHNAASLPFRAIAVQIIGTSNETRISYEKAPQEPTAIGQDVQKTVDEKALPAPNFAIANHAEIKVRNITPPQVQFTGNDLTEPQKAVHKVDNLHFAPIQAGYSNNDKLLSSTIFSPQVGIANAVVEGFTQTRNLPVLRMLSPESLSERLYALDVPVQDLPMGSQLEFKINPLQTNTEKSDITAGAPDNSAPMINASHFLTLGNWPIMEEIQQSLVQVNAQTAQAFSASLPSASAPAQLGASALFFMAALRSGDVQSWLGEKAVDALKRSGKGSLLGRIKNEFSGLSQMNKERVSGEWRALSIPLAWQNDIQKLIIYTRHEDADVPDENDKIGKGGKTRFVVDLSLSNIGPLQLDGLFSGSLGDAPGETTGRLDLVLRTEQGFSKAMKQQMRSAYKNALDETRITGALSFQDHTLDWVRITPGKTAEYSTNV